MRRLCNLEQENFLSNFSLHNRSSGCETSPYFALVSTGDSDKFEPLIEDIENINANRNSKRILILILIALAEILIHFS